jgi:hypothetical protein
MPAPDPPQKAKRILNKDYSYLDKLDADGWLSELTRLHNLSVDNGLGLHEPDLNTHTIGEVGESGEASEVMTVQVGVPAVELVEFNAEGFRLPPERLPALIVNARAPGKVIREQIDVFIAQLRDRFPPPIKKPGPPAPNTRIDQRTFSSWSNWRIVQLAELFAWRATLDDEEAKEFPDWVIGEWMWDEDEEIPRKTSDAKKRLKEAIASRKALKAQIDHETPPPEITQDIIWSAVLNNMTSRQNAQGEREVLIPKKINICFAKEIKGQD